jgi:predicted oxidoreductase (fatty acid repression mutant protein)
MSESLYQAMEQRRSIYHINGESPIGDGRIEEIVGHALRHVPSPFNCQSARVVILLGEQHQYFWKMVWHIFEPVLPQDRVESTRAKIHGYGSGHGTLLFFEDQDVIDHMIKQFPLYEEKFPVWAQNANGMLQYALWTALEAEGLGASLQHYNPLIDNALQEHWQLPESWKLTGQMPFGGIVTPAGEKHFQPLEKRMLVFK